MSDDTKALVERLREMGDRNGRHAFDIGDYWNVVDEAADTIERLERKLTGAYERAAQVCDEQIEYMNSLARADRGDVEDAVTACAEEIRALKGKPLNQEE